MTQAQSGRPARRRVLAVALAGALAAGVAGVAVAAAPAALAAGPTTAPGLAPGDHFYVPPAAAGSHDQEVALLSHQDNADAKLIEEMEDIPSAVWFTGGTPAQIQSQVQGTMVKAAIQKAVPVMVAYDIPGRDCAQYSAGGAADEAAYDSWISSFATGLGASKAVVILEPDGLGLLPSSCGGPTATYPFTDAERFAEISYAVNALTTADPNANVYLDATHSSWQSVGTMTQRLVQAGVQKARGFFVNVSNYQPTPNLIDYGTWISDCISIVTDPNSVYYNHPDWCASQYYPANPSDFSTWGQTTAWYAANMGSDVATTHFVIDTSRNGNGPNNMQSYAAAPYNQPSGVVSALASGSWCNPPGAGLGILPTADTGVPLLDAYLWVKTPGQSDGQCDAAGGARAWDYTAYTQSGWPADAAGQAQFDPLWGAVDPAAGAWFPAQALQLAKDANPALP